MKEKATRSRHKGNISTLDKEIKLFEKERKKDSNGICVDFEDTLSGNNIPYKAFSGGHMPYSVGRLMMKNIGKIIYENIAKVIAKLEARTNENGKDIPEVLKPISVDQCREDMKRYK